jgi:large subunit ribosomal protein L3
MYAPRKRAKQKRPRVRHWSAASEGQKVLGFAGYKAGMTHLHATDERKGRVTSGMEIFIPVTVIDAPPMNVFGFRAYGKGYEGDYVITDVICEKPPVELKKTLILPKKTSPQEKISELKEKISEISNINLLVSTQPSLTSMAQKKPDVMEIAIAGSVQDKFNYAVEHLGKLITAKDALKDNTFADVTAVTKGKGFQGIMKRFGVRKQPRKSTQKRRHMGTGGPITPSRKFWFWPTPGQHGYHTRTEYNKAVIKIGADGKEVTPAGGFLHYGPVKGDYVIVKGSIPGPAKRIIRLTAPRRQQDKAAFNVLHIDLASKQGA